MAGGSEENLCVANGMNKWWSALHAAQMLREALCCRATQPVGTSLLFVRCLLPSQISTVNMGLAVGWSAVVLGYGRKGLRKSLPHSLGECLNIEPVILAPS